MELQLLYACRDGKYEEVKHFLSSPDINVNVTNASNYGETPLICACFRGHIGIVKLLLGHPNINLNLEDTYGFTPLIFACYHGHLEVVQLLLATGKEINLNAKNFEGNTAKDIAKEESERERRSFETEEKFKVRKTNCQNILRLLESFELYPKQTCFRLKVELGQAGKKKKKKNFFFFFFF